MCIKEQSLLYTYQYTFKDLNMQIFKGIYTHKPLLSTNNNKNNLQQNKQKQHEKKFKHKIIFTFPIIWNVNLSKLP